MQFVRSYKFVFGLVFLLFAGSFTFGDAGVRWMWQDTPIIGGVILAVSLFFWVLLYLEVRRRHQAVTR